MRARMLTVGVALCVACKGSEREVPKPPAKLAGVRVVDLIPVSLSGESWQDAEPFLALYASNPRLKAEAAMRRGFEAYRARNGSASCQLSPLSETGIKSTTRTPASLAGGFGTSRSDPLQATHRATPTVSILARIAHAPPGFAAARGSRQDNGSLVADAVMRARNTMAVRTLQLEVSSVIDTGRAACSFFHAV